MSWFRIVIRNWKFIVMKFMVIENSDPSKSWSRILQSRPYLDGMKLQIPQSVYLWAGYINLKTHEVVENPWITPYGKKQIEGVLKYIKDHE